jgi:hypothetical protein
MRLSARIDVLKTEAEQATEEMRRVHPEAAEVLPPSREWRALLVLKAKLRREIAEEMGQLVQHIDRLGDDSFLIQTRKAMLGLAPDARLKAEKRYLAEGHEDLSGFRYEQPIQDSGRPGTVDRVTKLEQSQVLTVSEIKAQIQAEEQRSVESEAQQAFWKRYQELMAVHGIEEDFSHLDNWVPAEIEAAIAEAEAQFAKDYPDAVPVTEQTPEPAEEPVEEPEMELYRVRPSAPQPTPQPVEEAVELEEPEPEPAPEPSVEVFAELPHRIPVPS